VGDHQQAGRLVCQREAADPGRLDALDTARPCREMQLEQHGVERMLDDPRIPPRRASRDPGPLDEHDRRPASRQRDRSRRPGDPPRDDDHIRNRTHQAPDATGRGAPGDSPFARWRFARRTCREAAAGGVARKRR
jgi:hypothetical protein